MKAWPDPNSPPTHSARVVIVTGGAYGIGRGLVRYFSAKGDRVLIADLHEQRGLSLAEELQQQGRPVKFVRTNISSEESVRQLISEAIACWGRIDVLCNNAGIERPSPVVDCTDQDWAAIMDTNLKGAFLAARASLPHLSRSRGSIINISSVHAFGTNPGMTVYAATKSALLSFTRGLALETAPSGVRVNALCPGTIHTGLMEDYLATLPDPDAVIRFYNENIPLGRIGTPEDIAPLAYFLTTSEASFITGANFVIDGGLLARLPVQ